MFCCEQLDNDEYLCLKAKKKKTKKKKTKTKTNCQISKLFTVKLFFIADDWYPALWQDSVSADPWLQQTGARGGRPIHPRRALCHEVSRQKEV